MVATASTSPVAIAPPAESPPLPLRPTAPTPEALLLELPLAPSAPLALEPSLTPLMAPPPDALELKELLGLPLGGDDAEAAAVRLLVSVGVPAADAVAEDRAALVLDAELCTEADASPEPDGMTDGSLDDEDDAAADASADAEADGMTDGSLDDEDNAAADASADAEADGMAEVEVAGEDTGDAVGSGVALALEISSQKALAGRPVTESHKLASGQMP